MRARRARTWNAERGALKLPKPPEIEYPHLLEEHISPLRRLWATYAPSLQEREEPQHLDGFLPGREPNPQR